MDGRVWNIPESWAKFREYGSIAGSRWSNQWSESGEEMGSRDIVISSVPVSVRLQWSPIESLGSRHYYENCDRNERTVIGWVELKMLGNLGTGRSIAKSCSSFLTKSKPIFLNPAFEIFTSDGWGKSIPQDGEPEKPYLEAVRTTEDLSALSKIDLSHFIKLFPTRKYFP